jgi:propanol-preferring alcohol dehydrogenase
MARGVSVSAAFDFVGAEGTLELAMASMRPAGRVVQVGLAGCTAHVTALKTVKPEVSVFISWWGNSRELREVLSLAERGRLTPIPLEFWPLAKINDVYERVKHGQVAGQAVITP